MLFFCSLLPHSNAEPTNARCAAASILTLSSMASKPIYIRCIRKIMYNIALKTIFYEQIKILNCSPDPLAPWAYKTGYNLLSFNFNIRGRLSITRSNAYLFLHAAFYIKTSKLCLQNFRGLRVFA